MSDYDYGLWRKCKECDGTGEIEFQCPICKGKGFVVSPYYSHMPDVIQDALSFACWRCKGYGTLLFTCIKCDGKGKV